MYSISLFLHIVGALAIFAGLAIEQAALFSLSRASTNAQVREWLSLLRTLQRFMGPAEVVRLSADGLKGQRAVARAVEADRGEGRRRDGELDAEVADRRERLGRRPDRAVARGRHRCERRGLRCA